MKINIGSGYTKFEGFLNIDSDPLVNPDYCINLDDVNIKLPFDDSTVEEIKAHHILEHIGAGFIPLIKELYRVAADGCIFDIEAPNETHSVFWGDPTHVRAINVNVMSMFSKKYGKELIERYGSYNVIALQQDIDFEVVSYKYEYDEFYRGMLENFFSRKAQENVSPEEDFGVQRLLREANNVAQNNIIIMRARK